MGSAYAEVSENEKGSITAGKLAYMVLLNDRYFSPLIRKNSRR